MTDEVTVPVALLRAVLNMRYKVDRENAADQLRALLPPEPAPVPEWMKPGAMATYTGSEGARVVPVEKPARKERPEGYDSRPGSVISYESGWNACLDLWPDAVPAQVTVEQIQAALEDAECYEWGVAHRIHALIYGEQPDPHAYLFGGAS